MYDNRLFAIDEVPKSLRDCFDEVEVTCGAPWQRVVEREASSWEARKAAGHPMRYGSDGNGQHQQRGAITAERPLEGGLGYVARSITHGWQPTCTCDAGPPVPATLLDPFAGSGTVLAVAKEHGRHAIGIEANLDYIQLAQRRIAKTPGYQYQLFD